MSKKLFWVIGISYAGITFIFHTLLNTAFGEFLMQVSYVGLLVGIVGFSYHYISAVVRQERYNRKRERKEEE